MRPSNPIGKGVCAGLTVVATCSVLATPAADAVPAPGPHLMAGLASLGTGLLLAYVIEAVWATRHMRGAADYEKRLGFLVGLAAAGLAGVVVALLISAHLEAGHSNLLDAVGLSWVVVSLGLLGGMVVTQPLVVHEWAPEIDDEQS